MDWTDDRVKELKLLQQLLMEVQSINTGNRAIEHMQKAIEIAETLYRNEIVEEPRAGFMSFLETLCGKDRSR